MLHECLYSKRLQMMSKSGKNTFGTWGTAKYMYVTDVLMSSVICCCTDPQKDRVYLLYMKNASVLQ